MSFDSIVGVLLHDPVIVTLANLWRHKKQMKHRQKWFRITARAALVGVGAAASGQNDGTLTYVSILRLRNNAARGDLAPVVRIVSPLADAHVAPGESRIGAGSPNGAGFALNVEVV